MRGQLSLDGDGIVLRSIGAGDLDDLRRWKNANKSAFFFQGDISAEAQRRWYAGYLERADDVLFIVEAGGVKAGCLGARLRGGEVDCYNVIAAPASRGRGHMRQALRLVCAWAARRWGRPVSVLVVPGNPAAGFYAKSGFTLVEPAPAGALKLEYAG